MNGTGIRSVAVAAALALSGCVSMEGPPPAEAARPGDRDMDCKQIKAEVLDNDRRIEALAAAVTRDAYDRALDFGRMFDGTISGDRLRLIELHGRNRHLIRTAAYERQCEPENYWLFRMIDPDTRRPPGHVW